MRLWDTFIIRYYLLLRTQYAKEMLSTLNLNQRCSKFLFKTLTSQSQVNNSSRMWKTPIKIYKNFTPVYQVNKVLILGNVNWVVYVHATTSCEHCGRLSFRLSKRIWIVPTHWDGNKKRISNKIENNRAISSNITITAR